MFSLELLLDGIKEISVVLVESDNYDELFAIAKDADFRAWAGETGAQFIEVWNGSGNIRLMNRV